MSQRDDKCMLYFLEKIINTSWCFLWQCLIFFLTLLLNKLALLFKSYGDVYTCKLIRVGTWLFCYLTLYYYIYLLHVLDVLTHVLNFVGRHKNFPLEHPKVRRTYHHIKRVVIYCFGNGDRFTCLYFFQALVIGSIITSISVFQYDD